MVSTVTVCQGVKSEGLERKRADRPSKDKIKKRRRHQERWVGEENDSVDQRVITEKQMVMSAQRSLYPRKVTCLIMCSFFSQVHHSILYFNQWIFFLPANVTMNFMNALQVRSGRPKSKESGLVLDDICPDKVNVACINSNRLPLIISKQVNNE